MTDSAVIPRKGELVDVRKPDDDDRVLWSVTTLIGVLEKPALVYWSATETARAAIAQVDTWQRIRDENGDDEAIKWLAGARFRTPKGQRTAAELGTAVHAAAEEYVLTGQKPTVDAEIRPFLDQFDAWLNIAQPEYIAAEVTVYSATYGYAGTCDGFFKLDGVPLIFDLKTSRQSTTRDGKERGVYPEIALQLAAYRFADMAAVWRARRFESFKRRYYLLSQAEEAQAHPVPPVEGGVGIHISPDHCTAYPVRCDEAVFERFLYVVEAARWVLEMSREVIGTPLIFDEPALEVAS